MLKPAETKVIDGIEREKKCCINKENLHTHTHRAKRQILVFQNFPLNSLLSERLNICISVLRLDHGTVSPSKETALISP